MRFIIDFKMFPHKEGESHGKHGRLFSVDMVEEC